jgi:3-oxoacyl-[acyl-carrier protein] reductase
MLIKNQNILITGGGSGIGKYLVENLAQKANNIIILDKNIDAIEDIKGTQNNVISYQCDLTNYEQLSEVIEQVYQQLDVGVIINNAGYIYSEPLINMMSTSKRRHDIDEWNKTIQSNLSAAFYVATCTVDKMVAKRIKGLLLNISSISASGNIGQSAYSAAKAGLNALTTTWSKELGMFGIRSAAIAPGFFNTESTHRSIGSSQLTKWQQAIPLNRLGEVKEILSAVEFIIENDYFNGRILELDGGMRI